MVESVRYRDGIRAQLSQQRVERLAHRESDSRLDAAARLEVSHVAFDEEERENDKELRENGQQRRVLRLRGAREEKGAVVANQNELAVRARREDEALRAAVPRLAQRDAAAVRASSQRC